MIVRRRADYPQPQRASSAHAPERHFFARPAEARRGDVADGIATRDRVATIGLVLTEFLTSFVPGLPRAMIIALPQPSRSEQAHVRA